MSSPVCVTMARTESLASTPCMSSKFPPPAGDTCDTSENKPVESPTHNSCNTGPSKIAFEPESKTWLVEEEIRQTFPAKGLPTESFARMVSRLGQAASTSRQFGGMGTGGESKER